MMMQCLLAGIGRERLFGEEFPNVEIRRRFENRQERETDEQYRYRMYMHRVMNPGYDQREEHSRKMNPKGFWECPFTVSGILWRPDIHDQVQEFLDQIGKPNEMFCKIVSSGLSRSDPRFVSRIVLMVRDPVSVAKSQENLVRSFKYMNNGRPTDLFAGMRIHSPKAFIDSTIMLAGFMLKHGIPFHVVNYDDVLENPGSVLGGVFEFLVEKKADLVKAAGAIDPDLKRSLPEPKPSLLWEDADVVYQALLEGNFGKIKTFGDNDGRLSAREDANWICIRTQTRMVEAHCKQCMKSPKFAASARRSAQARGVNWRVLPCAWETAFRTDGESLISIDESIVRNHWVTEDDKKRDKWEASRLEMAKTKRALAERA